MKAAERFKHARRAGVPLVAINTPDPRATMEILAALANGKSPVVCWDCIAGLRPVNDAGREVVASVNADAAQSNPIAFLELAGQLPDGTVACFLQADAWANEPPVIQGIWNLRDAYKRSRRTLVLLARQIRLPLALQGDTVVMDEDLPDRAELETIARSMDDAAVLANPERAKRARASQTHARLSAASLVRSPLRPPGDRLVAGLRGRGVLHHKGNCSMKTESPMLSPTADTYDDVEMLVHSITHSFFRQKGISEHEYEEWHGEACVAFATAHRSYDRERGRFTTWLWHCVWNALSDKLRRDAAHWSTPRLRQRDATRIVDDHCPSSTRTPFDVCLLSADARTVVNIVLDTFGCTDDEHGQARPEDIRLALYGLLCSMGWSFRRIVESFHEIRVALTE